ncbi:ATP-dependent zinc metalloprotease FtsH (plasmid) [Shinella zoogloeoides]|nr:ATP-dependent zinc metalloprotease FtsH [Shinella zoogloeoides]
METLTDRMTRYLLKRLRRRAVLTLYERAVDAGLLASAFIGGEERNGTSWRVADQARYLLTGNPAQDRRVIARMIGMGRAPLQHGDGPVIFIGPDEDAADGVVTFECQTIGAPDEQQAGKTRRARRMKAGSRTAGAAPNIAFPYVAALLREHLPPPNPVHAAVALLVARAIGASLPDMQTLIEALRPSAPLVLLKAPVPRFELCVGMMLEDGLLLPFRAALEDVLRENPLSGRYRQQHSTVNRRKMKTLSGIAVEVTNDKDIRRQFRQTLLDEPAPILLVDETVSALTPVVTETADLVLECGGIDHETIAELLQICAGIPPKQGFAVMDDMAFDPAGLTLDDIALAIRPGRSAEQTLSILAMLIERLATEDGDERDGKDTNSRTRRSGKERAGAASSRSKEAAKKKPQDVGVEVVEPVAVNAVGGHEGANAAAGKPPTKDRLLSVEALAGYGPARDWALDLKADLSLWRDGKLRWDEMSTKLLLSGPPGTGKTTFARALCNTLQVPLLATSVANWLEPGYLGEVLRRMSGAFALAGEKAPAILFIDEIDNIGTRQGAGSRNYDDYWTSLINRLLELLDGASKSEGVIVIGATNLPEKIDPAILRSGRLETHVRIPMPDAETLIGILGHHLGDDLEAVLASAPAPATTPPRRLRPPTPINGKPPVRRKSVQKPQAEKGPRHD